MFCQKPREIVFTMELMKNNKMQQFSHQRCPELHLRRLPQSSKEKTQSPAESGNIDIHSQNQGRTL